jgi:hypothetical protein
MNQVQVARMGECSAIHPDAKWLGEHMQDRQEEEDRTDSFRHPAAGRAVDEPRAPDPSRLAGYSDDDDKQDSRDRNLQCVAESHGFSIGEMLAHVSGFEQGDKGCGLGERSAMTLL